MPESRTVSSFNSSRTKWFEWLTPKFNANAKVNFDESDETSDEIQEIFDGKVENFKVKTDNLVDKNVLKDDDVKTHIFGPKVPSLVVQNVLKHEAVKADVFYPYVPEIVQSVQNEDVKTDDFDQYVPDEAVNIDDFDQHIPNEAVKTDVCGPYVLEIVQNALNEEVKTDDFGQYVLEVVQKALYGKENLVAHEFNHELNSNNYRKNAKPVFIERPGTWCATCGGISATCMC